MRVHRESLKQANLIVVKLGTGVLTDSRKQPDPQQMRQLVAQVAALRRDGKKIVLVTSGAVGAGMGALELAKRPSDAAELQACAAIGQSRLMTMYQQLFGEFELKVAQVLLTHDDLQNHERHLNARNTLAKLLHLGVVPIINENDVVSITELKFGDNDKLSALVACLLPADLLVILTTVDGVMENFGKHDAKLLHLVQRIDDTIEEMSHGTQSVTAVGGMTTKIQAAKIVTRSGIPLVIASGKKTGALADVLAGRDEGTLFLPQLKKLRGHKRWIAFFHHPRGTIFVDKGAKKAVTENGKSLLLPGVVRLEGEFHAEDIVRICDLDGNEFARGIVEFSAREIQSRQLPRIEVIHRDDLVVL